MYLKDPTIISSKSTTTWNIIQFYRGINDDINKKNGETIQGNLGLYLNEAKSKNNKLLASKIIQDINELIDRMKIKKPLE
ncbi:hypothetical protein ACRRVD_04105 [Candidatus Cardinium hertigii]|uniref:hypothetical protein n=1 Tax=Candidatus Cardinium hertigii TaxID=247481 RepID=UPI003D7D5F47